MISSLLQQLHFNEKESRIYLTVLKHGKITPADVSNLTGINRTTVYSVTKSLVEKGVMSEDLGNAKRFLLAKPPAELSILLEKDQKAFFEKRKLVQKAIEELQQFAQKTAYTIPKIIFVPEEDLGRHLYHHTRLWAESLKKYDSTWWGFQDHTFVEHYEKWIHWSWSAEGAPNTKAKLLSNRSKIEQTMKQHAYPQREIKFWKPSEGFTATTWVCGDYIILVTTRIRPHYLVQIHDAMFAHNLRELFKGIWQKQG